MAGGAALYLENIQGALISNCTFEGNAVTGEGRRGGAIHVTMTRSLTIENSTFDGNSAETSGGALLLSMIQIVQVLKVCGAHFASNSSPSLHIPTEARSSFVFRAILRKILARHSLVMEARSSGRITK